MIKSILESLPTQYLISDQSRFSAAKTDGYRDRGVESWQPQKTLPEQLSGWGNETSTRRFAGIS